MTWSCNQPHQLYLSLWFSLKVRQTTLTLNNNGLCVLYNTLFNNDESMTSCFRIGTSDASGIYVFGVGSISHGLSLPQPRDFGFGHCRHCARKSGVAVGGCTDAAGISTVVINHLRGTCKIVGVELTQWSILKSWWRSTRGCHRAGYVVLLEPLANIAQAAVTYPRVAMKFNPMQTR